MAQLSILWETERLLIRDWDAIAESEAAFAIYGSAEVMAYIRPECKTLREVQELLEGWQRRYARRANGTGCWAMVEKTTNLPIGTILL
ncbi:MAG: GNAT family N-acetyltransferase, partial [Microcystaceae cyanobacterium]